MIQRVFPASFFISARRRCSVAWQPRSVPRSWGLKTKQEHQEHHGMPRGKIIMKIRLMRRIIAVMIMIIIVVVVVVVVIIIIIILFVVVRRRRNTVSHLALCIRMTTGTYHLKQLKHLKHLTHHHKYLSSSQSSSHITQTPEWLILKLQSSHILEHPKQSQIVSLHIYLSFTTSNNLTHSVNLSATNKRSKMLPWPFLGKRRLR